jgi:hypothetical protein
MITYPNQKVLHINKGNYTENYLTIGIDEWIEASKNLKPITFRLYLYIASNADGFNLALSRQDVMNKLGVTKNSYHTGVKELEEKGYIVPKQGNIYDFYISPKKTEEETMYQYSGTLNEENEVMYQSSGTVCTSTVVHDVPVQWDSMYQSSGTEIDKINKTSKISKEKNADAKKEEREEKIEQKDRTLEDLTDEELNNLLRRYRAKEKYSILQNDFSLSYGILSKELPSQIDSILKERHKEEIDKKREEEIDRILASVYISDVDYGERYRQAQERRKIEEKKEDKEEFTFEMTDNSNWISIFEEETGCTL